MNVELLVTGIAIGESNPPGCAFAEAWRVLFRGRIPRHLNIRCGSGGRGIFAGFAGGSLAHAAGSSDQIRKASPHSRVVYLARSGVTCQERRTSSLRSPRLLDQNGKQNSSTPLAFCSYAVAEAFRRVFRLLRLRRRTGRRGFRFRPDERKNPRGLAELIEALVQVETQAQLERAFVLAFWIIVLGCHLRMPPFRTETPLQIDISRNEYPRQGQNLPGRSGAFPPRSIFFPISYVWGLTGEFRFCSVCTWKSTLHPERRYESSAPGAA